MTGPIDSDAPPGAGGTMLLYDWFKHMTTLSLITLGGILGILQGAETNVRPGFLSGMIFAIALAGIIGFDGQNRVLVAELKGKPLPGWLPRLRTVAMASYGMGVGAFLSLIVESVG